MTSQVAQLEDRIYELEEQLGLHEDIPPSLGITKALSRILGVLLARELAPKETIAFAMYQGGQTKRGNEWADKSVEIQIMNLRKALKPHGIEIETHWGRGYFMTAAMKAKCRALFVATRAEVA